MKNFMIVVLNLFTVIMTSIFMLSIIDIALHGGKLPADESTLITVLLTYIFVVVATFYYDIKVVSGR